jgi:hypothetical protein
MGLLQVLNKGTVISTVCSRFEISETRVDVVDKKDVLGKRLINQK